MADDKLVFESAEEADFWRSVYIAMITTNNPPTIDGDGRLSVVADHAVRQFRSRKPRDGGPYR